LGYAGLGLSVYIDRIFHFNVDEALVSTFSDDCG
jgi:hypothetical protein